MIIEFGSRFRIGIEERVEDRLSENIEIFFEKDLVLIFVLDGEGQSDVVIGYSFFEFFF